MALPLLVFALTPPACFVWLGIARTAYIPSGALVLAVPYLVLAVAASLHPSPHSGLTSSLSRSGDIALLSSVSAGVIVNVANDVAGAVLGAMAWLVVIFPLTIWMARRNLLQARELRRLPEDALDWQLALEPEPPTPPTFWVLQCLKIVVALFVGLLLLYG